MNPLSLITKGFLGDVIKRYYILPFNVTIDYGEKIINVLLEEVNLLIETEQEAVIVEAGQEDLTIEFETINVEVKLD